MILVTGSTGHVGNVLVKELVNQGERVRAMALPGEDVSMIDLPGVEILRGDIRDRDFVIAACKEIDIVYHLAALISIMPTMKKQVRGVNIGGTENVIHACRVQRVEKLIYTSSIHAFTELEPGSLIDENVPFNPARTSGVYGKSKAEAVLSVLTAAREGLNAVVLCPTGIIGPFDYKLSEMGNMIRLFASGKLRVGIEGSFDFVDVRDVVSLEESESGRGLYSWRRGGFDSRAYRHTPPDYGNKEGRYFSQKHHSIHSFGLDHYLLHAIEEQSLLHSLHGSHAYEKLQVLPRKGGQGIGSHSQEGLGVFERRRGMALQLRDHQTRIRVSSSRPVESLRNFTAPPSIHRR